jgi:hypothetical protein
VRSKLLLLPLLLIACGESDTSGLDGGGSGAEGPILDGASDGGSDSGASEVGPRDEGVRDQGAVDSGPSPCDLDPSCVSCCMAGEHCTYSINCQSGEICNQATEEFYDPTRPADTCIRVTCSGPGDCAPGKVCSPQGVCVAEVCDSGGCPNGEVCIAGACEPVPTIDACVLVPQAIAIGVATEVSPEVIGYSGGRAVPVNAALSITANPNVVVGAGSITGGPQAGAITVSAEAGGLSCDNVLELYNYGPLPAGTSRVVVIAERDGAPIQGAAVSIGFSNGDDTGTTDVRGRFQANNTAGIEWVNVSAPGRAAVTVIAPVGNDLVVVLPPFTPGETAGYRGTLDLSSLTRADLRLGNAAAAFPVTLADFGYRALVTAGIPTTVNAPELGLNNETLDLPESLMMGLGAQQITGDVRRCQGMAPERDQLGCYQARVSGPFGAFYGIGSQLRLSEVTALAAEGGFFQFLLIGGGRLGHALIPYQVHPSPLPFVGNVSGIDCSDPTQLPSCRPRYEDFTNLSLVAADVPRVQALVSIPNLSSTCDRQVAVMALVELPGRGLVPLGFTSGYQDPNSGCELTTPLAPANPSPSPTTLPISIAAPHQGAEGHPIHLVAIILPPAGPAGSFDDSLQMLAVHDVVPAAALTLSGPRLAQADLTVERGPQRLTLDSPTLADVITLQLDAPGQRRLIYAPATLGRADLPVVAGTLELPDADEVQVSISKVSSGYGPLFQLGSGQTMEQLEGLLDAAATTKCQTAGSSCVIQ